jgi:hypothetical protein
MLEPRRAGTPASATPIAFTDLDAMTEDFWQTILATNLIGDRPDLQPLGGEPRRGVRPACILGEVVEHHLADSTFSSTMPVPRPPRRRSRSPTSTR